jgi:PAS domain S-box-containing protein
LRNRGFSRAEAIGKTTSELDVWVNSEDRDRFVRLLKTHGECLNFASSFKTKDGRIMRGLISARVDEMDGEACIFSNVRDVTELMEAEQSLRESEGRFRSVVASINEGLLITDIDDVILDLNDRMTDLTGFSAEELKGKPAYELLVMADEWPNMLARNQQRVYGEAETYEIKLRRKDGSWLWAEVSASPYRDTTDEVVGTLGIVSDITERKRLEAELLRVGRMTALGEMAQGVALNFNNILTVILGYSEIIQAKVSDPEIQCDIQDMVDGTLQAAELVKRLNLAVRSQEDGIRSVHIGSVALKAIEAARPRWKDEPESRGIAIAVITDIGDLPPIQATESGLHDIFTNLLSNGIDALPESGTIRVVAKLLSDAVELTVSDNGVGMEAATRQRVFEPFFTTKAAVGTGLGLSIVNSTLTLWGGACQVDSVLGEGSTFRIRFRIAEPAAESAVQDGEIAAAHSRKIVVVDGDEDVRRVLSNLLSQEHEVDLFQSGPEVLEHFSRGCCEVVVIDLGMPGMPGDQLARRIREIDDRVPIVMLTGWELDEDDPRLAGFDMHLTKPVRAAILKDTLTRAIELHYQRAG